MGRDGERKKPVSDSKKRPQKRNTIGDRTEFMCQYYSELFHITIV